MGKIDLSKPPSALSQLDLIEETANQASLRQLEQRNKTVSDANIYDLLNELRYDIQTLKSEQVSQSLAALPPQERQLHDLLNELRHDIQTLKTEQVSQSLAVLPPQERQLHDLLSDLHRDIEHLKGEQAALTNPQQERQLQTMLSELRRDITNQVDGRRRWELQEAPRRRTSGTLAIGVPLGILAGIGAAVALMMMSGQIQFGSMTNAPPVRTDPTATNLATPEQLIETASTLLRKGDIAFARRVLSNAVAQGSIAATVLLASTYDPELLAQAYNPSGVAPDPARAEKLYESTARAGNFEATMRLERLRNGGK